MSASVAAALLLCAIVWTPAAVAQLQSTVHLSPYYLGALKDAFASFPKDEYGGRSFRVFGIDETADVVLKGLNRAQAKQACLSVGGLGLAGALNPARKAALDEVLATAERALPSPEAAKSNHWVGGFRTSLSDPFCMSGPVTHFPYFEEGNSSSYANCGKDPEHDWGWTRPKDVQATGQREFSYVMWRELDYNLAAFWDTPDRTGLEHPAEPTGFNAKELDDEFYLDKNEYSNCTVARVYREEDQGIHEHAKYQAWWRDWGCKSPLVRWVCEMPDEAGLGDGTAPPEAALSAGYYLDGVSNEYRSVTDSMKVRLFGILPQYSGGLIGEAFTAMSWDQAQHACLAMKATGLAFGAKISDPIGRHSLMRAAYKTLYTDHSMTSFTAWLAGFTTYVPANATAPIFTTDFTWSIGLESEVPFGEDGDSSTKVLWATPDYPTSNETFFEVGEEGDPTSCMFSSLEAATEEEGWKHEPCGDKDIQFFMCQFAEDHPAEFADMGGAAEFQEPAKSLGIEDGDDNSISTGAAVGIAIGLIVAVSAAVIGGFLFVRQRRRRNAEQKDAAQSKQVGGAGALEAGLASFTPSAGMLAINSKSRYAFQHASESTASSSLVQALRTKQAMATYAQHTRQDFITMMYTTEVMTSQTAAATAGSTSSAAELISRLEERLQHAASTGQTLGNRYLLQNEQRVGGQGVVQFATGLYNGYEYAIKFFINTAAFEAECVMYKHPVLSQLLPRAEDVFGPDSPVLDSQGCTYPPAIVMEKGEALDEWSQRAKADVATAVQVMIHLATRLSDLHKAALVHRDLKPSNVMWLPRENRWTVIDFGCAAPIGTRAPIAFSLPYAAPEAMQAMLAGNHEMTVHGGLDCWAVGVMAYELLTGERGINVHQYDRREIMDMLASNEGSLPWEGDNLTKEKARQLGVLRRPILQMLHRNPEERASMLDFKSMLENIFSSNTTMGP